MPRGRELIATLPVLIGFATAQSGPQNLGFEHGQPGASPQGWVVPTPGYAAKLTSEKPKAGVLCAELVRSGESGPGRFGNLMQSFDATAYRGKRIRFRAAVRINTVLKGNRGDRAQLWLRVDRRNGQMGFFDNMDDRPIREPEWNYFEITGDVETDAERINIGMIVFGSGKAWIDDVSFEALGNAPTVPVEAARALTRRGLEDEIAFARLFGYVRYFHPSDQAIHTDWTSFAIRGAREVESARDDTELAQKLTSLFSPIAPTVRALTTVQKYALPANLLPPKGVADLRVTYWRHLGDGLTSQKPNAYHSERVEESAQGVGRISIDFLTSLGFRSKTLPPDFPWNADVGGGVRVWVPVALYADSQGTLPYAPIVPDPPNGFKPVWSASDRGTRLGDVIIAWNVFQHFYPYFDVVNTDWSSELRKALASAATDKNDIAFTDTLRRLVAALHDGHGNVVKALQRATLPLTWDWIEGKLVITAVAPSASGRISAGDAVLKIDGRDAGEALATQEDLISGATPQWIRYRALGELAGGNSGENVNLEIEPFNAPGKTTGISLQYATGQPTEERRPSKVAEIEPHIYYIDVSRVSDADFQSALTQLEKAHGIVFDFRGYPSNLQPAFLTHLSDAVLKSAQWHFPVVLLPDRKDMQFERRGEWLLTPTKPFLAAKKAFITDGRAISYAESCMGIVEYYRLGAIVGAPTAGTNGNTNPFSLPGGYFIAWTGMKVLKHDGSRHHGVGILPTIPVSRTRAGVGAGHDEFLERAVLAVKD